MTWKACGSTRLPLGDREREWDQESARERIFRWAGWEDNPTPAKAKRAFFAFDDETPTNVTCYKLPYADVVGGELRAMPRALFAVAQLLRGARDGVDLPAAVLRSARRKVTAYYHTMGEQTPWEEEPSARDKQLGRLTPAKRRKAVRAGKRAAQTRVRRTTRAAASKTTKRGARKKRAHAPRSPR